MEKRKIDPHEISEIFSSKCIGNGRTIEGLNFANVHSIYNFVLTYAVDAKFLKIALNNPTITAIMTTEECYHTMKVTTEPNICFFLTDDPVKAFYSLHHDLYENTCFYDKFDFPKTIGKNSIIHDTAVIDDGVIIGDNVIIGPHVVIEKGTVIGHEVSIKANTVIGGNGFEVRTISKIPRIIKHVGRVKIHNNVEIGSNCCIDRSLFEAYTEIGENTKIDNLVHIGHNVKIGGNCILVPGVILTGGVVLKNNIWVSPNVVILNGVQVNDNCFIGTQSFVIKNVKEGSRMFGIPATKIN